MQRCCRHPLHVRPDPQIHTQLNKRVVSARSRLQQDRHPFLGRNEIRPLRQFSQGGARRDLPASEAIRQSYEGKLDLQFDQPQYQCAKGEISSPRIIMRNNQLTQHFQIFKIVLSKAFDLRCTIPEIENVGEPLLLYQSVG
jgi:hypothetical protein